MTPGPDAGDDAAQPPEHSPGNAAVEAASKRHSSAEAKAAALAYFMGEKPAPGTGEQFPLYVEMTEDEPKVEMIFRSLETEEIDKANLEATKARDAGAGMLGSGFVGASYIFAYACVEPDLGLVLERRRSIEEDPDVRKRLTDTASLVREVFRKRGGVLEQVAARIDGKSKIGDATTVSTEVEAGKGSR